MTRPRKWVILLAVCALVATGCTTLPTASAPERFDVSDQASVPLDLSAAGPTQNSTPTTLVNDFLLACAAGPSDDFQTARKYLTQQAASAWRPTVQVQIYASGTAPTVTGEDPTANEDDADAQTTTVNLTATLTATLDQIGVLTLASGSPSLQRSFQLTKQDGQWRIATLEDEVILSEASFKASFQQGDLFFPSSTRDALVADPRWYPARRLSSLLLSGLMGGPSELIADSVVNAIPAGITLPSQGVTVEDGVAVVELSGQLPADGSEQRLLASEITQTLMQARAANSVRIKVSGVELPQDGLLQVQDLQPNAAVGIHEGQAVSVSASNVSATGIPVPQGAVKPARGWNGATVTAWLDGDSMTITGSTGTFMTKVGSPTWPSVDRYGWAWSANSSPGGAIQLIKTDGSMTSLPAPVSTDATVKSLRISPDGARALMVIQQGNRTWVSISTIQRDYSGTPQTLSIQTPLGGLTQTVMDASWAGSDRLVALVKDPNVTSGMSIAIITLGGFTSWLQAPDGAQRVTAGGSPSVLWVMGKDNTAFSRSGSTWQTLTLEAQDVQWPG